MVMMDPTLQRNMFKGQVPPVNSEGVGITDGLVENEKQVSAEALTNTAEGMQNLFNEIDSADNPEAIMQALRGGDVTLESLRKELADLVGKADATKTPESVLTLLQPTMLMLEASEQVPEGGINEAMPMQAPGTEEASARIAMGEVPVNRKLGSGKNAEIIPKFPNLGQQQGMKYVFPSPMNQNIANTNIFTQGVPNYKTLDFGNITGNTQQFMEMYKPFLEKFKPRTTEEILAANQKTLAPFLKQPRSAAEIEQELVESLGKGDADARDMQLYLQLAKAGRDIFQSGEKPLTAIIDAAVDRVPETGQILASDAKAQRDIKLAARAEAKKESDQLEEQNLKIALDAIGTENTENLDFKKYMFDTAEKSLEKGLSKAQVNNANYNKAAQENFSYNMQFHGMDATTYAKVVNGKISDPVMVRRTQTLSDGSPAPNGLAMIKNGELVALPKGYIKVGDSAIAKGLGNGTVDRSKAKAKNLLIPDTRSVEQGLSRSGYVQYAGEYVPGAGYFYYPGGGKAPVKAPVGFIEGEEKDIFKVLDKDDVGRVFVNIKGGIHAGKTFLSHIVGDDGQITSAGGLGYSLEEPVYKEGKLKSGNPLVKNIGSTGIPFASTSSDIIKHAQIRIPYLLSAISELQDINKNALGDVYGPTNTIKSFLTNNFAALTPDGSGAWAKYYKTSQGRNKIETFGRKLVQSLALSDRYNVYEQQLLKSLAGDFKDGTFFNDVDNMAVKFANLNRVMINDLSIRRNTLDPNNKGILELQSVATGTENDPFDYGKTGVVPYLQNISRNDPSKKLLSNKFMKIPQQFVTQFKRHGTLPKSTKILDDGSLLIQLKDFKF